MSEISIIEGKQMKDIEMRGMVLQKYYEMRRSGYCFPKPEDFDGKLSKEDILHISDQLGEHRLINWKPVKVMTGLASGMGKISALGIDVVEGANKPPIAIQFSQQNITVTGSSNIAIGNSNTQTVNVQADKIIQAIDHSSASDGEKEEAKSLWEKCLDNPLLSKILGMLFGGMS